MKSQDHAARSTNRAFRPRRAGFHQRMAIVVISDKSREIAEEIFKQVLPGHLICGKCAQDLHESMMRFHNASIHNI
jgi:hypothetical protein